MQEKDSTNVDWLVGKESMFWPDGYRCPKCGSPMSGQPEEMLPPAFHTAAIIDLTAAELYAALSGLGLPDEQNATIAEVTETLTSKKITKVVGTDVEGTGRCVLDHIVFEDGTQLHLGSSSHGAVVYRVVRPASYTERALKETE